jgi:hypothetical protein
LIPSPEVRSKAATTSGDMASGLGNNLGPSTRTKPLSYLDKRHLAGDAFREPAIARAPSATNAWTTANPIPVPAPGDDCYPILQAEIHFSPRSSTLRRLVSASLAVRQMPAPVFRP